MRSVPLRTPEPPRGLVLALAGWNLALVAGHAVLHLSWRGRSAPRAVRELFAAASEASLISWTSIVAMFCAGALCFRIGSQSGSRGWYGCAALFTYLSMDDGARIHERLGALWGPNGAFTFGWVYTFLPTFAVLGALAFVFIWRGTRRAPRARRLSLFAFAAWGLALALEVPERALETSRIQWNGVRVHRYSQFLEEWLEMTAPMLLGVGLWTLLRAPTAGPRSLGLDEPPAARTA